jgi:serine/threonine protein kinase
MYEMLTCKTPFEDTARKEEATMRNILKQPLEFPSENSVFDETKKSFLSSLLQKNPLERLGSEYQDPDQVAKHPYFASLSFEAIASRTAPVPWVPELAATTDSSYFDA